MTLEYQFDQLCNKFREGSHATQANRRAMLKLFTEQLAKNGYDVKTMSPKDLKGRHVNKLLEQWRKDGVSTGTIKNRMVAVRWWAEKVGNSGAVKDNATYKIENRVYVTNENKSISLKDLDLSKTDPNIAQSLRLQDAFGLRREESMKFQPEYALDGQKIENAKYIRLKDSWTKGGRPRT
ncbi:integrase, partial [Acinetobacter baumannii]